MRRALARSVLVLSLLALVSACGGAQRPAPDEPLTIGAWCGHVGPTLCRLSAQQCFGGVPGFEDGCREQFMPSCLGGRDPSLPAGRVGADLDRCLAGLEAEPCSMTSVEGCALDPAAP